MAAHDSLKVGPLKRKVRVRIPAPPLINNLRQAQQIIFKKWIVIDYSYKGVDSTIRPIIETCNPCRVMHHWCNGNMCALQVQVDSSSLLWCFSWGAEIPGIFSRLTSRIKEKAYMRCAYASSGGANPVESSLGWKESEPTLGY